ncbi:MAG: phosphatidylserine decarboxylase [Gammaproteobacteria bacterium]
MRWCHQNAFGWWLMRKLLAEPWVSALYGWMNRLPCSRIWIADFVARMGIDPGECREPLWRFSSFAAFIEREIDLSRRPVDPDRSTCVSPVDGRLLVYDRISTTQAFAVKHTVFDLRALVGDERIAQRYDGGTAVILRLHLADYHHFHFPVDGIPGAPSPLGSRLFAMSPYSHRRTVPYLSQNVRVSTTIASEHFGNVLMMEIGAFTVGSVHQAFEPGRHVARGERKGWFALGGSCVVLLFESGALTPDEDLLANTRAGIETYVRMGEAIGRFPGKAQTGSE